MRNITRIILIAIIIILILAAITITVVTIKKTNTDNTITADLEFELNSNNKYEIVTDFRWMSMLDDGGSNTNIYYQIDLDNNIVKKIQEDYHANLLGTPTTDKHIIYTKNINTDTQKEIKVLLNEVMSKEDINETSNFNFFTISSLNYEKYIYNIDTIKDIKTLLEKIDKVDEDASDIDLTENKKLEEIKQANQEAGANREEATEEEKERDREELKKIEQELKELVQNQV